MGLEFITVIKLTRYEVLQVHTLTGQCSLNRFGVQELQSEVHLRAMGRCTWAEGGRVDGISHLRCHLVVNGVPCALWDCRGARGLGERCDVCGVRLLVHDLGWDGVCGTDGDDLRVRGDHRVWGGVAVDLIGPTLSRLASRVGGPRGRCTVGHRGLIGRAWRTKEFVRRGDTRGS